MVNLLKIENLKKKVEIIHNIAKMTATAYTPDEIAELLREWQRHLEYLVEKLAKEDDGLCGLDNSHLEPGENHPPHAAEILRYERRISVAETAISTIEAGGRLDEAFAAMACKHRAKGKCETAAAFEAAAKKWTGH